MNIMDCLNNDCQGQILLYEADDGRIKLDVRLENETVWLTQKAMSELFQTSRENVTMHLRNIFSEHELEEISVCKDFLHTALDGKQYNTKFYNLDAIISVGYRVKSHVATRFRIWATERLKEYIVKGFTLDDQRLKNPDKARYFEELLARIRDIRSSEKVFWRKILDIYATSIDYEPNTETSQNLFKEIQNKMHWATHGHTAAEVIYNRANAELPNMGITNYPGNKLLKRDTEIAKNYLSEEELNILNRIVTAYLELAEIQALNQVEMNMKDWAERLKQFLTMTGREFLTHSGKISHEKAIEKAHDEYEKYRQIQLSKPTEVEKHFIEAEQNINELIKRRQK